MDIHSTYIYIYTHIGISSTKTVAVGGESLTRGKGHALSIEATPNQAMT